MSRDNGKQKTKGKLEKVSFLLDVETYAWLEKLEDDFAPEIRGRRTEFLRRLIREKWETRPK